MTLLQMGLSGAAFIAAVLLLRRLALHRLPKRTFVVLWLVVLCRLLLPFDVASPASVYTLLGQARGAATPQGGLGLRLRRPEPVLPAVLPALPARIPGRAARLPSLRRALAPGAPPAAPGPNPAVRACRVAAYLRRAAPGDPAARSGRLDG